jgi:hypothetical protein
MKAIGIILIVLFGGFILLAMILPAMSQHTEALYTRMAVERLEELRLKAVRGDISQAASSLNDVVGYWPTKVRHEGHFSRLYELSRAAAIREIISRMRSLSGEELGDDPKVWIEKFYRKETTQPNQSAAANRRPAGQSDGSGNLSAIVAVDRAFPAAVAELGR